MKRGQTAFGLLAIVLLGAGDIAQGQHEVSPTGYRVVGVVGNDYLNLRKAPDHQSAILQRIAPNARGIQGTGRKQQVGTEVWLEIVVGRATGWVNSRYLVAVGASTAPPAPIPAPATAATPIEKGLSFPRPTSAAAEHCPAPLADALRLVLVTAASMNTSSASVRLFKRDSPVEEWIEEGKAEPAVIGLAGMAWGNGFIDYKREGDPEKIEGDKRTPAGIFRIGQSFGFTETNFPRHVVLKAGETVCVEDPSSAFYNKIIKRQEIRPPVKVEDMSNEPLYRNGLFVEYPTDRDNRRGSCVFIHVWRAPNKGTLGCLAMPEHRVVALQDFSQQPAALAILPRETLSRFGKCLPAAAID